MNAKTPRTPRGNAKGERSDGVGLLSSPHGLKTRVETSGPTAPSYPLFLLGVSSLASLASWRSFPWPLTESWTPAAQAAAVRCPGPVNGAAAVRYAEFVEIPGRRGHHGRRL